VGVVQNACLAGVGAGELDGSLNGLGSRVAEEHALDLGGTALDELLGQESGQQRAVHLHHVRQVRVDCLMQGVFDGGVAASEREDPESAQEVKVALARLVVEVAAFGAHVEPVHTEGF
jgi:hypothetical protein